jgi:DNA-binding MarR family transcriptional regulator
MQLHPDGGDEAMNESNAVLASKIQLAAIHLLRRVRQEDKSLGLSAAQLSVLHRLVRGGPMTITDLASAERVRPPTMSRLVQRLEKDGLVMRILAVDDRRVRWIEATHRAWVKLEETRSLRVLALVEGLARLSAEEKQTLAEAVDILERIATGPSVLPR